VLKFEWDDANRRHIALHGVTPEDCETAMYNPVATVPGRGGSEWRQRTTGITGGRRLDVIWTLRGERVRVVTAYWKGRKHQ
jgi:uncharacterized DUF497 family protein